MEKVGSTEALAFNSKLPTQWLPSLGNILVDEFPSKFDSSAATVSTWAIVCSSQDPPSASFDTSSSSSNSYSFAPSLLL